MSSSTYWMKCPTGKRSFPTERAAERALGQARTRRKRRAEKVAGTARGMTIENRVHDCDVCGGWHTTSMSRREFNGPQPDPNLYPLLVM